MCIHTASFSCLFNWMSHCFDFVENLTTSLEGIWYHPIKGWIQDFEKEGEGVGKANSGHCQVLTYRLCEIKFWSQHNLEFYI